MSTRLILAVITLLPMAVGQCDEITLLPIQDATLYEEGATNENGLGLHLFAGLTNGGDARRSLLAFDIMGNLPSDATVTSASLSLTVDRTAPPAIADTFGLHRVTRSWEEGQVQASREGRGQEGSGSGASWSSTGVEDWSSDGGDFLQTASASVLIGERGLYTWESEQLVADVQGWLDGSTSDFGWALVGTEVERQSAKRFVSSQNEAAELRPTLRLEFENVTEMLRGDFDGDGELLANDVNLLCDAIRSGANTSNFDLNSDGAVDIADQVIWVEDVRGTSFGDANLDGRVSFEDFLVQSVNFAQTPIQGGWADGDFDCSGTVGFPDFLQLSANFGFEAELPATSVPEPEYGWLLCAIVLLLRRRR